MMIRRRSSSIIIIIIITLLHSLIRLARFVGHHGIHITTITHRSAVSDDWIPLYLL